ncbi:hypothetical protein Q8A73_007570 [Channa argus]|nr:hypothetical protein Q8A73_007570 [Channa argus]
MKIKTLSHTPSPAPFFQPLFQQYEGSLQEWLSPQGTFALMYKTEEILTTSDVTVVPKPMTKDPEENQVFHNPSVTQLAFTQCQTSYVGLPGTHEVSPPVTIVCPGDTSYTQLPSSIWGLNAGEVQVISSPPKDVSEMSCCDSGCSFESPTESPECSLPTMLRKRCVVFKTLKQTAGATNQGKDLSSPHNEAVTSHLVRAVAASVDKDAILSACKTYYETVRRNFRYSHPDLAAQAAAMKSSARSRQRRKRLLEARQSVLSAEEVDFWRGITIDMMSDEEDGTCEGISGWIVRPPSFLSQELADLSVVGYEYVGAQFR